MRADPFRHRYTEITKRETWNSHGTDSHESRYVRPLMADEAVAALAPKHADVAERLERFEQSCERAHAACEDLLEVALKACAQDRGERYRDGTELVAALESLA